MATYYSSWNNEYRLRLEVTYSPYSIPNNTTPVNYSLYLEVVYKAFNGLVQEGYLNVNGVRKWTSPSSFNTVPYGWNTSILLHSGSATIAHDQDGTKSLPLVAAYSANSGGNGPVGLSIDKSLALPTIPRYAAINSFTVAINDLNATMSWTADKTISQWRWSSNNGSTYSNWITVNASSGSLAVAVTPGSAYNFKIQVRASDSGLDTTSSTVSKTATKTPSTLGRSPAGQNLGSNINWTISEAHSVYVHKLTYSFGSASGYILGSSSTTSTSLSGAWTLPNSLADQIPNATAGSGTLVLYTYYGAQLIGSKSVTFSGLIPDTAIFKPIATITDVIGVNLLGGRYVKGKSSVRVKSSATLAYSSPITQYKVAVDGSNRYGTDITSGIINKIGAIGIVLTVTDGRTRTGTDTESVTFIDYFAPRITTFNVGRSPAKTGTDLSVMVDWSIAPVDNQNAKYFNVSYREIGGSWVSIETNTAEYSSVDTYLVSGVLEASKSYEVKMELRDSYHTLSSPITITKTIGTVFKLLHGNASGKGLAIGKYSESDMFEVALPTDFTETPTVNGNPIGGASPLDVYPVGAIYMSVVSTSPATLFGGTWSSFGAGRVLVGYNGSDTDFNSSEKTGGSKTHTLSAAEMPGHTHTLSGTTNSDTHTHSFSATTANDTHNHYSSFTSGSTTVSGTFNIRSGQYTNYNIAGGGTGSFTTASQNGSVWGNSVATSTTDMKIDTVTLSAPHTHSINGTTNNDTHNHSVSGTTGSDAHSHTVSGTTSSTGSGSAHNNVQPYITVYMWKRTA